jgi:hypothetical protein
MCGLICEAISLAFKSFDIDRGESEIPSENRFLTHWRHHLSNLARIHLRKPRSVALPSCEVPERSDGHDWDLETLVMEQVDQLPSDDRLILRLRFWEQLPFSELAKKIKRRKQFVIKRIDHILGVLEANLNNSPLRDARTGEGTLKKVGTKSQRPITLLISVIRDRAAVLTPPQDSAA